MTTVKIMMRLHGIDLRDDGAYERIPPELGELGWEAAGRISVAVVYAASPDPAAEAIEWARRIEALMPGVHVAEVHDELVTASVIASRVGVAAGAMRMWDRPPTGALRPFPAPRQAVGGSRIEELWAWREVVSWVRDVIGIDPDQGIGYLDGDQVAELNAAMLPRNRYALSPAPAGWEELLAGLAAPARDGPPRKPPRPRLGIRLRKRRQEPGGPAGARNP